MPKARFVGDPRDNFSGPTVLRHSGFDFAKRGTKDDVWIEVPQSVADKLAGHDHFEVEGVTEAPPEPEAPEDPNDVRQRMLDYLDQKGVRYKKTISDADLKALYDETVEEGPEDQTQA